MPQMPRLVSLILMATLIVALGLTFYQVVAPFLMPLFLAAVLAILCQPIYRRCLCWTRDRTHLAAGLTAVILAILLVPITLGTVSAARQLYRIAETTLKSSDWKNVVGSIRNSERVQQAVKWYGEATGEPVNVDEIEKEVDVRLRDASRALAHKTLGIAGSPFSLLGDALSMLISAMTFAIAFYYFLVDGPALVEATINLIPVHREYQRQIIAQFDQAVRAVVSATFAAAIGQGIATGLGMQIAGFHHFFLVTILATLTALVPLLGTWLIWGPYVLYLWYFSDNWVAASMLALYGAVFVGLLDNVIRTYVLQSNVKLHPLLAFVSVLGGIQALGLWGLFIGPIVASCLHALVKIFNKELVAFSQQRQVFTPVESEAQTTIMTTDETGPPPSNAPPPAGPEPVPPLSAATKS
ncbi:MAG TPA: AI-2E family transporter, partial [Planctomycetaceae bacterium]|nr:AI-2E family transporter [Planctomycetaceae bacterium]